MTAHCLSSGLFDGNKEEEAITATKHTHVYILTLLAFSMCMLTNANVVNMQKSGLFVFEKSEPRVDGGGHGVQHGVCVMSLADVTQLFMCTSPVITCHNKHFCAAVIFFLISPQQHLSPEDISASVLWE